MPEIIMKMIQRFTLCLLALLWPAALFASINLPGDPDGPLGSAAGIFRGTVLRIEAYSNPADGLIYTRTVFQVAEARRPVRCATFADTRPALAYRRFAPVFAPAAPRR